MKKYVLIVVIIIVFLSCKDKKEALSNNINKTTVYNKDTSVEIANDNIYYLNIPGNTWLKSLPDDKERGNHSSFIHKRKVVVVEEVTGWKKVDFDFRFAWFEDRFFVRHLDEIVPDYNFIRNAVGRYYYDRIEVIKNDYEFEIPWVYNGNVIILTYNEGDEFNIKEVNIKNENESHRNQSDCYVPNNNIDSFDVGYSDGVKSSHYYEYYFIDEGIKIRIIPRHFIQNGEVIWCDELDSEFIYDIIYLKKE
jgi:hypothetical protein